MDIYYEISVISVSYGGHRQHTIDDGQNRGSSSLTCNPQIYPTKVQLWKKYKEYRFFSKNHEKNREIGRKKFREI